MPWTSSEYQYKSLGGQWVADEIKNDKMVYATLVKSKPLVKSYLIKSKIDTSQIVTKYQNIQGPMFK